MRTGRRGDEWKRANGQGDCKNKPQPFQRISTLKMRPVHADCQDAMRMLSEVNEVQVNEAFANENGEEDSSDEESVAFEMDDYENLEDIVVDLHELFE